MLRQLLQDATSSAVQEVRSVRDVSIILLFHHYAYLSTKTLSESQSSTLEVKQRPKKDTHLPQTISITFQSLFSPIYNTNFRL